MGRVNGKGVELAEWEGVVEWEDKGQGMGRGREWKEKLQGEALKLNVFFCCFRYTVEAAPTESTLRGNKDYQEYYKDWLKLGFHERYQLITKAPLNFE